MVTGHRVKPTGVTIRMFHVEHRSCLTLRFPTPLLLRSQATWEFPGLATQTELAQRVGTTAQAA